MYWNMLCTSIALVTVLRWIVTLDVLKSKMLVDEPVDVGSWIVTLDVLKY